MIYSSACGYAIRALTQMAMLRPDGYLLLEDICRDTDLPRHYIAKVFQDLVRRGLLFSAKGRGGGFALARRPEQIILYQIVAVTDGVEGLEECVLGMAECDDNHPCPQHQEWGVFRRKLRGFFEQTTLATMAETLARKLELVGRELPTPRSPSKPLRRM